MIPDSFREFPGWVALIAAIALVLASWTALVGAVLEILSRRSRRPT